MRVQSPIVEQINKQYSSLKHFLPVLGFRKDTLIFYSNIIVTVGISFAEKMHVLRVPGKTAVHCVNGNFREAGEFFHV